jgi:hypothetical protein
MSRVILILLLISFSPIIHADDSFFNPSINNDNSEGHPGSEIDGNGTIKHNKETHTQQKRKMYSDKSQPFRPNLKIPYN